MRRGLGIEQRSGAAGQQPRSLSSCNWTTLHLPGHFGSRVRGSPKSPVRTGRTAAQRGETRKPRLQGFFGPRASDHSHPGAARPQPMGCRPSGDRAGWSASSPGRVRGRGHARGRPPSRLSRPPPALAASSIPVTTLRRSGGMRFPIDTSNLTFIAGNDPAGVMDPQFSRPICQRSTETERQASAEP